MVSENGINRGEERLEDTNRDAMFAAFREVAKILDPLLTDEAITSAVDDLISRDALTENYLVGNNLTVSYVPIKELSNGKSECRVDILVSDYN